MHRLACIFRAISAACCFVLIYSASAMACSIKTIKHAETVRDGEKLFFLTGTPQGNFTVKSWQFDSAKMWDGNGEPALSLATALEKAKCFYSDKTPVGIGEIALRPSLSKDGQVIWFYLVTLKDLPYAFRSKEYQVAVLLSGEVVEPFMPMRVQ